MSQDRENVLDAAEALGALPDAPSDAPFAPGEAVGHEVYGNGTVRECVMAGQQWSVRVNFGTGERRVMSHFLKDIEDNAYSPDDYGAPESSPGTDNVLTDMVNIAVESESKEEVPLDVEAKAAVVEATELVESEPVEVRPAVLEAEMIDGPPVASPVIEPQPVPEAEAEVPEMAEPVVVDRGEPSEESDPEVSAVGSLEASQVVEAEPTLEPTITEPEPTEELEEEPAVEAEPVDTEPERAEEPEAASVIAELGAVEVEAMPVVEEPAEPEDEWSLEASQARATMQVVAQRLGLEGDEPWKVEDGESLEISQARAVMLALAQRLGLEGDVQPVEDGMFNTDTKLLGAAPEEWRELEEIDKDAELEDYCENGIWDIDGLRDDLKLAEASRTAITRGLMKEKLGKKVKPSGKTDEQESEVGISLSPGDNDSSKKTDYSSVKSKLEVLRELKALLDEKIIDDEEFKKMKKEIIN